MAQRSLRIVIIGAGYAACYHVARERFPLPASIIQQARDKALAIYRGIATRKRRGKKTSRPRLERALPLRIAVENLRIFPDTGMARLTTPLGFLWLPLIIPAVWRPLCALPHAVSECVRRGRDWYLMLAVKSEDVPAPDGPHFGLDLGVANLAVLSGPEVVKFWDGKPLRSVRGRFFRYRQALQQKRKLGMVKRSKGKEARWATQMNHQVSREIVDLVAAQGGVLHVEKLLGIRDRVKMTRKVNRMVHSWSFAQLLAFITYKAARAGVQVIEEDPRHTSQRCSRCGHTERKNRHAQSAFCCVACGYTVHADLNAARNLAAKGACSSGVGSVTEPLNGEVLSLRMHHGNRNLLSALLRHFGVRSRLLQLAEDVTSLAFLVLLEQLTPVERAAFLLREVFDYEYAAIAAILEKDEAACRQLCSRAKKHIAEHRPRFKPKPEQHRQLLSQFMLAVSTGQLDGLMTLLSNDVTMWADGGGKARGAATRPLHGRAAVAQFVLASTRFLAASYKAEIVEVNSQPAAMLRVNHKAVVIIALEIDSDHIYEIRVIGNPDKLRWV